MFCRSEYITVIKFILVGVTSNLIGFFLYIILSIFPINEKFILTGLFFVGSYTAILGNSKFTFASPTHKNMNVYHAIYVYFSAYILNLSAHFIFVDLFNADHRLVQFICIGVIAIYIYAMLKWIVSK